MELTRYDRERLAQLTAAVAFAGHAVPVGLAAKLFLTLPMEAGGLFLGPLIGFPAAGLALYLLVQTLLLATGRGNGSAGPALAFLLFVDVLVLLVMPDWRHPLLVLGAVCAAVSLGLFVSLVRVDLQADRNQLVIAGGLAAGGIFVVLLTLLAG